MMLVGRDWPHPPAAQLVAVIGADLCFLPWVLTDARPLNV